MQKAFIIEPKHMGADTYHIKDVLKLNGFKWSRVAKRWFTEFANKAKAENLLKVTNLNQSFQLVEVEVEQLANPNHRSNLMRNTISMKQVKAYGVSNSELNKLIQKNRIRVMLFELDNLNRKINKQLSLQDVKREFKNLPI